MLLGIENTRVYASLIANKNIGLITNFTGVTSNFQNNYDVLKKYGSVKRLFTPEHGLHGVAEAGETVSSYYDHRLSMNIVSLYGDHHAPTISELDDIQVLIYDIQDVGIRYYTYIYTLLETMRVAAKTDIPVIVLDRPILLGRGSIVGQQLKSEFFSFVGLLPLPNSYQLTVGELAQWIKETQLPELNLTVVPMIDWNSKLDVIKNEVPWLAPSPNLPSFDALRLYSGLCLLEGTNVSEGRGTVYPFQQIGAPWIDGTEFAKQLTQVISQKECLFQPVWFIPLSSKYTGEVCQGIRFHIKNQSINSLKLGYTVLSTLKNLYPELFKYNLISKNIGEQHSFIEYLSGASINQNTDFSELGEQYGQPNDDFQQSVKSYYLY